MGIEGTRILPSISFMRQCTSALEAIACQDNWEATGLRVLHRVDKRITSVAAWPSLMFGRCNLLPFGGLYHSLRVFFWRWNGSL